MKKILILSANPTNTSRLRLDKEVREIQEVWERSKNREQFEIIDRWAVRPDDLQRAFLEYQPQIVHFAGHGAGDEGLVLENDAGEWQLVSTEALANLFGLCRENIECVLLNACYSEVQAQAIYQHIDCVMGMNQKIGDEAAIKFAKGFYLALSSNRSYEEAYQFGCNAIDLNSIPESSTPVIKSRKIQTQQTQIKPPIELENPEGQVPLGSAYYVERPPVETDCYQQILQFGALIRIKAPRQMGKTSLMSRILNHAIQHGCKTTSIDFQTADEEFLSDLDKFLQWFCASITYNLNLPEKIGEYWQGVLGSKNKCTNYFQRYLLTEIDSPIALGLDEVDEIFKHPQIASGFFGLLRAWHERAKNDPAWKKLRLVIVHSKEVYIPLNINQSPFNVGFSVELPELNQQQVKDLVQLHQLTWSNAQVKQLMMLMGGHPYLVRVALYEIARERMTLNQLEQIAPTEAGPYNDHLRRHLLNLEENKELLEALKQVVTADQPVDVGTTSAFKLRSMGLVKFEGNKVMPLCDLYRKYFCDRLGWKRLEVTGDR